MVTRQVIFAKADDTTMKLTEVPVELLADTLDVLGKHFNDAGMICAVVGLLTFSCGEDTSS